MTLAARIDDYGKPAWIAAVILALIIWWPLGLGLVAYLFWSGRMGCWNRKDIDHWRGKGERWMRSRGRGFGFSSSGNRAFDDYKAETLRRLEDEQQRVLRIPRPPAQVQGPGRVRPVHGRSCQPHAARSDRLCGITSDEPDAGRPPQRPALSFAPSVRFRQVMPA